MATHSERDADEATYGIDDSTHRRRTTPSLCLLKRADVLRPSAWRGPWCRRSARAVEDASRRLSDTGSTSGSVTDVEPLCVDINRCIVLWSEVVSFEQFVGEHEFGAVVGVACDPRTNERVMSLVSHTGVPSLVIALDEVLDVGMVIDGDTNFEGAAEGLDIFHEGRHFGSGDVGFEGGDA